MGDAVSGYDLSVDWSRELTVIRLTSPENCSGCYLSRSTKWLKFNEEGELAGEPGFEPRLTESESAVLPLNYSPIARGKALGVAMQAFFGE